MDVLGSGPHTPRILIAGIPDAYQIWRLFVADPNAQLRWFPGLECPPILTNPTSTARQDVIRREAFRLRVIAYNVIMTRICRRTPRCGSDAGAVFAARINAGDIATVANTGAIDADPFNALPILGPGIDRSSADYWHPSVTGQARIASIVWAASSLSEPSG